MTEEKSIKQIQEEQNDKINKIMEAMGIQEEVKEVPKPRKIKKWKMPWKARSGARNKVKKGKILVVKLQRNRTFDFEWAETEFNTHKLSDDIPREYSEKDVWLADGKIPALIQPMWDLKPLNSLAEQQNISDPEVAGITIKGIEKAAADEKVKKGGSGLMWLMIIIGVGVVGYLAFKYFTGG
jgi:hypothetical protein